jgi:hypothetical protein
VKIVPAASGNNIEKLMAALDNHITYNLREFGIKQQAQGGVVWKKFNNRSISSLSVADDVLIAGGNDISIAGRIFI